MPTLGGNEPRILNQYFHSCVAGNYRAPDRSIIVPGSVFVGTQKHQDDYCDWMHSWVNLVLAGCFASIMAVASFPLISFLTDLQARHPLRHTNRQLQDRAEF